MVHFVVRFVMPAIEGYRLSVAPDPDQCCCRPKALYNGRPGVSPVSPVALYALREIDVLSFYCKSRPFNAYNAHNITERMFEIFSAIFRRPLRRRPYKHLPTVPMPQSGPASRRAFTNSITVDITHYNEH